MRQHDPEQLELDLDVALADKPLTPGVLRRVRAERARQDQLWGPQNHRPLPGVELEGGGYAVLGALSGDYRSMAEKCKRYNAYVVSQGLDPTWDAILLEEVFEALGEAVDAPEKYEEELVQVAAVAVNMIENSIRDRKGRTSG
jgi:hypothetical protein